MPHVEVLNTLAFTRLTRFYNRLPLLLQPLVYLPSIPTYILKWLKSQLGYFCLSLIYTQIIHWLFIAYNMRHTKHALIMTRQGINIFFCCNFSYMSKEGWGESLKSGSIHDDEERVIKSKPYIDDELISQGKTAFWIFNGTDFHFSDAEKEELPSFFKKSFDIV